MTTLASRHGGVRPPRNAPANVVRICGIEIDARAGLAHEKRAPVDLGDEKGQIRPEGNIVLTAWVIVARAVASSEGCSDSITIT